MRIYNLYASCMALFLKVFVMNDFKAEFAALNERFAINSHFIARQISMPMYKELLATHNVEFQGTDHATRAQLAKVLAGKGIVLN